MGQMNTASFDNDVSHPQTIDQLRSFCRGEMAAVETYLQAIEATKDEVILGQLRNNLTSHQGRVELLRQRIQALGGEVPESSGPWGTFAKVVEGTASVMGQKSALAMLEEGEDHGLADYRADFSNLDIESRRLIAQQILPQQIQTHDALSRLQNQ